MTFKEGDRVRVRRYDDRTATVIEIRPKVHRDARGRGVVVRIDGFDTGDKLLGFDELEPMSAVDRLGELGRE